MKLFEVQIDYPYKRLFVIANDFNDARDKALNYHHTPRKLFDYDGSLRTQEEHETVVENIKMLTDEIIR
jgi:hypothetical protein